MDPEAIQKLAPLTTQQESQFDYLTPVVASHEAESLAPFVLPRIGDQALSRQSHAVLLWVTRAPSPFTHPSPSRWFRRLPPSTVPTIVQQPGQCLHC